MLRPRPYSLTGEYPSCSAPQVIGSESHLITYWLASAWHVSHIAATVASSPLSLVWMNVVRNNWHQYKPWRLIDWPRLLHHPINSTVLHQQQPQFPSETPGCSGRLWRLWRNLVPSDGELHAARRPGDALRCIAEHLGAPATNLWASGSTSNHSRAFWENQHLLWERCWCAWNS